MYMDAKARETNQHKRFQIRNKLFSRKYYIDSSKLVDFSTWLLYWLGSYLSGFPLLGISRTADLCAHMRRALYQSEARS
jgi:hypothetical protein